MTYKGESGRPWWDHCRKFLLPGAWPSQLVCGLVLAAPKPLFQHLDGPTRAKALATLAGLVILGAAMLLLTWLGARAARRYANQSVYRARSTQDDDWAGRSLAPPPDPTPEDES